MKPISDTTELTNALQCLPDKIPSGLAVHPYVKSHQPQLVFDNAFLSYDGQTSRSDDECIQFRPSPNFKHMKKYLKSKFEETASHDAATGNTELATSPGQTSNAGKPTSAVVQPPLPPNPPPDDLPPIVLKQEIEDDDYQCNRTDYNAEVSQSELITEYKTDESEVTTDEPQETMCRNFIRGTCTKGASCRYVHKLILSQLLGVYRFCRNFQNKGCKMPKGEKCKFVHANVFEKEKFFRTGYLPPHTMSHLKEDNASQPPPPPPEESQAAVPIYSQPPPPIIHPTVTPVPVMGGVQNSNMDVFKVAVPASTSPLKRGWSDSDDFSSSPRDLDTSESLAKKCKNCDNNEFRLQFNKDKIKKMMRNTEDMNTKIAQLSKKNNKLNTVLLTLLKPKSSNGLSGLNASLNISVDKEKAILEQLNMYLATNNRLSSLINDDSKSLVGNNISSLLAKHILSSGDPTLSPDAS